jgi:hypothetical protein
VRRVDEDLGWHALKEALDATPVWRIVQHVEVDVAGRVSLASDDGSCGDDSERRRLAKDERDSAAKGGGVRLGERGPLAGREQSVVHDYMRSMRNP